MSLKTTILIHEIAYIYLFTYLFIYIYTVLCQPQGVDTSGNQHFRVGHSLCLATPGFRNGVRWNVNHMNRYNECDISVVDYSEEKHVYNAVVSIPPCSVDHTNTHCTVRYISFVFIIF